MSRILFLIVLAAIGLFAGCTRQPVPSPTDAASPNTPALRDDQKLPFDRPAAPENVLMPSTAMLPRLQTVPAGTAIDVRLQSTVSSASSHSGDSFLAVLDRPIVVDGETLVPAGTSLSGRVVTAKRSLNGGEPGFLRLTLASIAVSGKQIPVGSSSMFARGGPNNRRGINDEGERDIRLIPERRLKFRLAQPLKLQ
jgi:hypothetical protein